MAATHPTTRSQITRTFKDLTGQRFGRYRVVSMSDERRNRRGKWWNCICDCGTERAVRGDILRNGGAQSCGCLRLEIVTGKPASNRTHNLRNHPLYGTWAQMINRCTNPRNSSFHKYGGRGITVCERWLLGEGGLHGFKCFLADMPDRPEGTTLDRTNNDLGYTPDNCRWATPTEQGRNTRRNHRLTFNGESLTLAEWAERTGIRLRTLLHRVESGWSVRGCLTTPLLTRSSPRVKNR